MAKAKKATTRTGMPSPDTVVAELTLVPTPAPAGAKGMAAGPQNTYRVLRTNQMDEYDRPLSPQEMAAETTGTRALVDDNFAGTARKATKLSIGTGAVETFADVKALIASLVSEADMMNHKPPITTAATSARVKEEQRNVKVSGFLYAASREADNDFHLIVGCDPTASATYMTMEVSALPPAANKALKNLQQARGAFKAFFAQQANHLPGLTYDFYDPPIPVEIGGSLFFDMTHAKGPRPGPKDLKADMPTIWEVHPVTSIVFEP